MFGWFKRKAKRPVRPVAHYDSRRDTSNDSTVLMPWLYYGDPIAHVSSPVVHDTSVPVEYSAPATQPSYESSPSYSDSSSSYDSGGSSDSGGGDCGGGGCD
jgi:uncharacterized membrane protein YgcG